MIKNFYFFTTTILEWKYILNPEWNLVEEPQQYKYSSAKYYYEGKDEFGFMENYFYIVNSIVVGDQKVCNYILIFYHINFCKLFGTPTTAGNEKPWLLCLR